jgi:hypothetical protein
MSVSVSGTVRVTSSNGKTYNNIRADRFNADYSITLCGEGALHGVIVHLGKCSGHERGGCTADPIMYQEFPSARSLSKKTPTFTFAPPLESAAGQSILRTCNAHADAQRGAANDLEIFPGFFSVTLGVTTVRDRGSLGGDHHYNATGPVGIANQRPLAKSVRQLTMSASNDDMMADVKNSPANSGWVRLKIGCLDVLSGKVTLQSLCATSCRGEALVAIHANGAGTLPYDLECGPGRSWQRSVEAHDNKIGVDKVRFDVKNNELVTCALRTRIGGKFKSLDGASKMFQCHTPTGVSGSGDLAPDSRSDPAGPRPPRFVADPPRVCPQGTVGTWPNCRPRPCPKGTVGTYPNCRKVLPPKCPPGMVGRPPNCRPRPCPPGRVRVRGRCKPAR